jgi:transcription antitermination factor NusG
MQFETGEAEWFAAQVRIGRERMCQRYLQVRGYDVFLPCCREHRRWSDRLKLVERALFDGYIFCRASDATVGKIVTTPGVIRIVGDGRRPVPIPREDIEAIQRVVDSGQPAERWPYVHAGQRVDIEWGPLRGVSGIVTLVKGRDRLIVSISLLQRSIAVEIDSAWVSVASQRVSA